MIDHYLYVYKSEIYKFKAKNKIDYAKDEQSKTYLNGTDLWYYFYVEHS